MCSCRIQLRWTITNVFLVDKLFQSTEQKDIVLACGARGLEVQDAFNTPEEQRDQRQRHIVRICQQNGSATARAWEKEHLGQVMCLPPLPHQSVRCSH